MARASAVSPSAAPRPRATQAAASPARATVTRSGAPARAAIAKAPEPKTAAGCSDGKTQGKEACGPKSAPGTGLNNPLLALVPLGPSAGDWRTSPHDELAQSFDSMPSAMVSPHGRGQPKNIVRTSETLDIVVFLVMLRLHLLP